MKKYITINDINDRNSTASHIMLIPDHLIIECRICSDGACITLYDENRIRLYGLLLDAQNTKLCFDIEETEYAHIIERSLVNLTQIAITTFLESENVVLNLDGEKEDLEEFLNFSLDKLKASLHEKNNQEKRSNKKKKNKK